jgi:Protein of unknown function (DUF3577)
MDGKFYDLHVTGVGYLNRVRRVTPRKGKPFLACAISALRGESNQAEGVKPETTRFDVRVYGTEAEAALKQLQPEVDADKAVLVGFKLGDIYAELFQYRQDTGDKRKGDPGLMIKGRLLRITHARVDGEAVSLPHTESEPVVAMQQEAA